MRGGSCIWVFAAACCWGHLAVAALAAPASQPTSAAVAPTTAPAASSPADAPLALKDELGPWTDDGGSDDDSPSPLLHMFAAVAIVLAVGVVGIVLVKKLLPRIYAPAGRNVSVVETTYLGPRKAVHLLKVGVKTFMVASSRENISMLADVTEALPAEQKQPADGD